MPRYEDIPDLGSLDQETKAPLIGRNQNPYNRVIDQMIAEAIKFARVQILGNEVVVKVVNLGDEPALNVLTEGSLDNLERGIWRNIDDIRMLILKLVDPPKWATERRHEMFPNFGAGCSTTKRPRKNTTEGAMVPRETTEVAPRQDTLIRLFAQIKTALSAYPSFNKSEIRCPIGGTTMNGEDFLYRLDQILDFMQKGTGLGNYRRGSRSLYRTYEGVSYQQLHPWLTSINGVPSNPSIRNFIVNVNIEIDRNNNFQTFSITVEKD